MYGLYQVQDPSQKALHGMQGSGATLANQQFMRKEEKTMGGGLMAAGSGAATGAAVGSAVGSIAGAAGTGAATGSAAGPWGAVAGAAIGLLSYFFM